jgi:protein TonB
MQTINASHSPRLDPGRITAGSGAIAVNAVLLLALLVPLSAPPPAARDEVELRVFVPLPKPKPVQPPPIEVPVRKQAPRMPAAPTPPQAQRSEAVVDALPGDAPAGPPLEGSSARPEEPGAGTLESGEPLAGAHLEYANAPPPAYPREAVREGLTGTVMLQVLVDVDGRPLEVAIVRSSGHRVLDNAARRQVLARWTFRPAVRNGRAVQAIGVIPVEFKLDR